MIVLIESILIDWSTGFNEEPKLDQELFYPATSRIDEDWKTERLDFRGITDAAGTTFSHSLVIMVLSLLIPWFLKDDIDQSVGIDKGTGIQPKHLVLRLMPYLEDSISLPLYELS